MKSEADVLKVLIRNGFVFDTNYKAFFKKDILLEDKWIREVADGLKLQDAEVSIDANGSYVTPGLIDTCSSIGLKE